MIIRQVDWVSRLRAVSSFLLTPAVMQTPPPFLNLPAELRNHICEFVALNQQPFQLEWQGPFQDFISTKGHGLVSACRQLHDEYTSVLRKVALAPGSTIVAAVHDFDFSDLAAVVDTLKPEEIATANRNHSFVAQLFVRDVGKEEANNLRDWLDVCDRTGIEVGYVLNWTRFSLSDFRCLEIVLQGHRECPKIWRSLGAPSVSWSTPRVSSRG